MSRLYLYGGFFVLFVILGLYAWGLSNDLDLEREKRSQAESLASGLALDLASERAEALRVNSLLESLETKEAEIRYVETIVEKEIVRYRDRVTNRCTLSNDWLCIHNTAAKGVPTDCGTGKI